MVTRRGTADRSPTMYQTLTGVVCFLYLNYNKRGITADLNNHRGRDIVLQLLAKADVLVLADSAPELDQLHLYYDDLREMNPSIIVTVITPYGLTGPYRNYTGDDLTAVNHGGLAYVTPGLPDVIGGSDKGAAPACEHLP